MENEEKYDILIEGLRKGNKDIFDRIFRIYYSDLVRYCVRFVQDDDTAEEIVQDVFVNLWDKHSELKISSSLKPYLFRSVQNSAVNYINKQKNREKYEQYAIANQNDSTSPLETFQENDLKNHFEEALLTLPDRCREIFELRRFDGMKSKEIADKLNISVKTVEKQFSKALVLLKNKLQDYLTMFLF